MPSDLEDLDDLVKRALPSAPTEEMESDAARVWQRLRSMADQAGECAGEDPFVDVEPVSVPVWRRFGAAAAMAAAAVVVLGTAILWRPAARFAVVESVDASLYRVVDGRPQALRVGEAIERGQTVRTNGGAGAMLALADGSRIEMRSQSELSLERADDGVRIQLSTGGIIVNAAKQHGHLYVQTKDVMVSVVGTVFLVNAESEGSRVAVIEGEVHVRQNATVQQKATETKLRPGEQVASSPTLAARSVKEEIAWSRRADAYGLILASFAKGMAETSAPLRSSVDGSAFSNAVGGQTAGSAAGGIAPGQSSAAKPQFEEASIRPCDPDSLPPAPQGARGGGANSFQMTPGRTHVLCMTIATVLRHAYGYGPADLDFLNPGGRGRGLQLTNVYGLGVEDGKRVRGGPEWVRSDHYTIEAVADGAADAATMSGPMMRELLERRFQLKAHIETEQVAAFNLTIAKGGLKIKPVDWRDQDVVHTDACASPPPITPGVPMIFRPVSFADVRRGQKPTCGLNIQRNGPNIVLVGGAAVMGGLARSLAGNLGVTQVFDKSGNTDRFNFVLEFAIDENVKPLLLPPALDGSAPDVPRGQTIFTAVEEQLGLKLEPARAPRDFIMIDRVERPSPN